MSDVSGVGARRHFSSDEEAALRQDESTGSIVKRDTRLSVEIRGVDPTQVDVKHHQQSPLDNKMGAVEVAHAAYDAAELAGIAHGGAATAIGGAFVAFGFGLYSFHEAQEKGHEQAGAIAKDAAHVALIGALDLPESYKTVRLEGAYKHVPVNDQSPATQMAARIIADPKGRAVLQLHADRGMNAARDLARSGLGAEAFLKANPRAAASYASDAAFREGFDAYRHVRTSLPPENVKALDARLDERDGWYAQSQVSFRV